MQFSPFLSPSHASGWIWGAGVIAQLPTHSDSELGNNNWGLGPTAVVLRLGKDDPWVYGMLINNVWSLGTSSNAPSCHIVHLGRLPVNAQLGAYSNIVRPDNDPTWQLRAQVQFMFPK
jgi:hypothetical protein